MALKSDRECMIWTAGGACLQTEDRDGLIRSHYVGRHSLESVRVFCGTRGLALSVHQPGSRTLYGRGREVGLTLRPARSSVQAALPCLG
jgi:hypothetical protein